MYYASHMSTPAPTQSALRSTFVQRHNGPNDAQLNDMLRTLQVDSLDSLISQTVPAEIRMKGALQLPSALSESEALAELQAMAKKNTVLKSAIGQGYYGTLTPGVVLRNVFLNPSWYTAYTPYQAEIAQGRLEALLNFQTVVSDLCGLPMSNASLLDEATAAAEAMAMAKAISANTNAKRMLVDSACHPQTIAVVKTRAKPLGIQVDVVEMAKAPVDNTVFAVLLQYPGTNGSVSDIGPSIQQAKAAGALAIVATDLLALTLLKSPGELGADMAVGSSQRFGVPMGYGGPHAAFFATKTEYARHMPGRIIGLSIDATGKPALRMALQTREQHIRREKATSNICTAQVLLSVMASMYAVYHGPQGLKAIALQVHQKAQTFAEAVKTAGVKLASQHYFDTVTVEGVDSAVINKRALEWQSHLMKP
jgi:glycine dehydrogenase